MLTGDLCAHVVQQPDPGSTPVPGEAAATALKSLLPDERPGT